MRRANTVLMILGVGLVILGAVMYFTGVGRRFAGVVIKQEDIPNAKPPFTGGTPFSTRVRAVTADGLMSERMERTGEEINIRREDGVKIWAFPAIKAKMSVRTQDKRPVKADMRDPKTECLKTFAGSTTMTGEAKAGEEKLLGYRTIKAVYKSDDRTQTNWYAPDLGCVSLQTFLEHTSGQTFLIRPKEVIAGKPAMSYFEEPAGLQEMPPSAIAIARLKYALKSKGLNDAQIQAEIDNGLAKLPPDVKARRDEQDSQYEAVKLHK
jgi:hypothetical protein